MFGAWVLLASYFLLNYGDAASPGRSFIISHERNCFLKDGECFRYISGGMHYFRIPSYYWSDRLHKAKMLGLNAIQTYVAWNVHEPYPGQYDFSDQQDLFHFLELAAREDLLVILRPGPYIDAEWEFGGFPWWLAKNASMVFRTSEDSAYLAAVQRWLKQLLTRMTPYLYKNGGPVIAFQVENEYGNYYSCDKKYMSWLNDLIASIVGRDVVLFTTDGYTDDYMRCGTSPEIFATIDFGTEIDAAQAFLQQRKYQPSGPLVNSEYYTGWLDYWGQPHQRRNASSIALHLDKILALNASVNLYMLIGGTNFGFMNGADLAPSYKPVPTSYDYDAPLSEAGNMTDKYFAIREVIRKYNPLPPGPLPEPVKVSSFGKFPIQSVVDLSSMIQLLYANGSQIVSEYPRSMEDYNIGYGFVVYRTYLPHIQEKSPSRVLHFENTHDFAIILVDGVVQVSVFGQSSFSVTVPANSSRLDILVENEGRLAYARKGIHYLPDRKGVLANVTDNGVVLRKWEIYPITDETFSHIHVLLEQGRIPFDDTRKSMSTGPAFYFSWLSLHNVTDTFLKTNDLIKGQAVVYSTSVTNLGRYWPSKGPQETLYVPKPALVDGANVILFFEIGGASCDIRVKNCGFEFVDKPIFQ